MNKKQNDSLERTSSVKINGTVVRLVFASERNVEAVSVVKDILKGAYLRSRSA